MLLCSHHVGQTGFVCPGCGGKEHCVVTTRDLYQCTYLPASDLVDRWNHL